jgi:DNA-binding GntR family transcriptional regulator
MKNVNSDIAYAYIRKRILSGVYAPGQALMTKDLSTDIGVSRTPVRDALRQLEADGLVIIRPHLGASVKTMESREYREMCGLRLALETYAAGLAANHRTPEELLELQHALDAMRQLTQKLAEGDPEDQENIDALRREDVRFHIGIITAAKSDLLKKEVLRLHIVSRVVSGLSPASDTTAAKAQQSAHRLNVQKQHEEIFRGIEKGDPAAAKAAMERHIQDIIDGSIRSMTRAEQVSRARKLSEEELNYTT